MQSNPFDFSPEHQKKLQKRLSKLRSLETRFSFLKGVPMNAATRAFISDQQFCISAELKLLTALVG